MIVKIIIIMLLYVYPLYCILREMYKLNKCNDKDKVGDFFTILFYLFALHLFLLFWVYNRKGYLAGFSFDKIESDFILLTLITSQVTRSLTRYLKKQQL